MAKQLQPGFTPSTSEDTFPLQDMSFDSDFGVTNDKAGEASITNVTAPVGYPEDIRFQTSNVTNVYKGTGVDSNLYAPSARGKRLHVAYHTIFKVVDSADSTLEYALPVACNTTMIVPNSELITAETLRLVMSRALSSIVTGAPSGRDRVVDLLKGVMLPDGI